MRWFCGVCRHKINSNQAEVWWAPSFSPDNCACGFSIAPGGAWALRAMALCSSSDMCACVQSCFANWKPATIESKHFLSFTLGMPSSETPCSRPRKRTRTRTRTRRKPHVRKRAAAAEARTRVSLWTGCSLRWGETPHVSCCFHSFLEFVVYLSLPRDHINSYWNSSMEFWCQFLRLKERYFKNTNK